MEADIAAHKSLKTLDTSVFGFLSYTEIVNSSLAKGIHLFQKRLSPNLTLKSYDPMI